MKFSASVSLETSTDAAATEAVRAALDELDGQRADVAFLFVSQHHSARSERALEIVSETLGARHIVGCTAESVLAGEHEHLDRPAISLFAASLPGVEIESLEIEAPSTVPSDPADGATSPLPTDTRTLIVLGDPFTFPVDAFLRDVEKLERPPQVVGGMASAARAPGQNRLFLGTRCLRSGAVAVAFSGGVEVRAVVSQGCRSFGRPLVVTRCEDNVIFELGGKPALEKFSEQVEMLSNREREALMRGLHIGRAIDSARASDGEGAFLIRGVLGFVKENGSMVIGDHTTRGQTIQFHLRDPDSADEELTDLLARAADELDGRAAGALLFTCNGRGTRMFDTEHHDALALRRHLGDLPVAGFFAAGEFGPVGAESFLHGFTAVTVVFASPNHVGPLAG